ncbi:metallophosphoesterase family protein [Rhizobium oryzicola]|uniref:Metallophosphoesterase family protein n=1 Tax=Rhizobium oryzicola TaxID=1232668 RepID=A0ABT8SVJ1_9HYPH|nr:metallophosphoesterase family protein [Rhizobium oryzicola]MDO1582460.1 metallophosphoesterase family protein [Rhizobium oryzicola]
MEKNSVATQVFGPRTTAIKGGIIIDWPQARIEHRKGQHKIWQTRLFPMKILLASDIHDNLVAAKRMRSQETDQYDALIIAGDIGSNNTKEIFDVFSSFKCPVLYVYGNWDHGLDYDKSFGVNCYHLHLNPFALGDLRIVGFSGCTAGWGKNPVAVRLRQEVEDGHTTVISELNAARFIREHAISVIEAEYTAALQDLMSGSRRKPSQAKVDALDKRRRKQLDAVIDDSNKIEKSDEFNRYQHDLLSVSATAQAVNRAALSDVVQTSEWANSRTIVVTHDRLSKTQNDFPGIPLFLFGHRHGFNETSFQGSQYVNVSVLDKRLLMRSRAIAAGKRKQEYKNLNTGNYGVMEWTRQRGFAFRRVDLEVDPRWQDEWEVVDNFQKPGAPFLA